MAATRDLWSESFLEDEIPALPCPWCDRGNLQLIKESLRFEEPESTKLAQQSGDITPLEAVLRFSLFMKCAVAKCGNVVSVHGNATLYEKTYAHDEYDRYVYKLSPKGMHPAPPLATIPDSTSDEVAAELRIAFSLFWIDLGSCANRLRISVERIMDEFAITKGKLFDRIQEFQNADPDHAATFDALRYVGNLGSHEGAVRREVILDAFEIYQDALAELFGSRKSRITAMKQKIIQSKGR